MKKMFSMLLIGVMVMCMIAISPLANVGKAGEAPAPDLTGLLANVREFMIMPGQHLTGASREFESQLLALTQSQRDGGYNLTNFARPEHLATIQSVGGLKTIVKMTADSTDWYQGANKHSLLRNMSPETIMTKAQYMVNVSAPYDDIVMFYYLVDEPGAEVFPHMKEVKDALHSLDSDKAVFVNLYPNYASASQLEVTETGSSSGNYRAHLDAYAELYGLDEFLRYDNFAIMYANEGMNMAMYRHYLENLMIVREYGLKYKIPVWNTGSNCQMRTYNAGSTPPTLYGTIAPAQASIYLQGWSTMAAGYKGMSWFAYTSYPNSPYDTLYKEVRQNWWYTKEINRQMRVVGDRMTSMKSTGVFFPYMYELPNPQSPEFQVGGSGELVANATENNAVPLMIGEFIDADSSRWFMVVNMSFSDNAVVSLSLQAPYETVQMYSSGKGELKPYDISEPLELAPGLGQLFKVIPEIG